MATRLVEIRVTGDETEYQAMVTKISEQTRGLNHDANEAAAKLTLNLNSVQSGVGLIMSLLGPLAGALGVAFSVGGIVAFGREAINLAGQIDDLSKRTGFSRQTLSAFKSTIEENGGTLESFASAVSRAQRNLSLSTDETAKAAKAFAQVGLNVNQLIQLKPEDAFKKIAETLSGVENQNNKVAAAMAFMGRTGYEQIPVLLALVDQWQQLKNKGLSDETIAQLDRVGDAFTRLKNEMLTAFAAAIAAQGDFSSSVGEFSKTLANLITFIIAHKDAILLLIGTYSLLAGNTLTAIAALGAYGLSLNTEMSRAQQQVAKTAEAVEILDRKIKNTQQAGGWTFGIFSGSEAQEQRRQSQLTQLQKDRAQAFFDFVNANNALGALAKGPAVEAANRAAPALPNIDPGALDKQLEALNRVKAQILQVQLATAEAARTQGDMTVDVRSLAVALIEQEKQAALTAAAHDKTLTPALRTAIEQLAQYKIAQIDAAERTKELADATKKWGDMVDVANGTVKALQQAQEDQARAQEEIIKLYKSEAEADAQIANLRADELRAIGLTTEADKLRLTTQLDTLKKINEIETDTNAKRVRDQQILNTQSQIQRLGEVTINVGQTITKTLGDAFQGIILGTSKFSDIGKNLLAGLARDAADFFSQVISKKLGWEQLIFSNLRGLPSQMAGAYAAGMASLPGGNASSIIGSQTFPLGGQGGGAGALGGIGGWLKELLSTPILGSTVGGIGASALGGLGIGNILGNLTGRGGMAGNIGSTIGSIAGNLLGGTAIGGTISSSVAGALSGILGSGLSSAIGNFILPGIGSILGFLFGALFQHIPDPSVWVKSIITFYYDALSEAFNASVVTTQLKLKDIKGSAAAKVVSQHQAILQAEAERWSDVLNSFPVAVRDSMGATLDAANEHINRVLGNRKYSEGGSRNIQQELDALKLTDAPLSFWHALRQTTGVGFQQSLGLAGLNQNLGGLQLAFPELVGGSKDLAALELPVGDADATQKFVDAIKQMAGFVDSLTNLGPKGVTPFLTSDDIARLEDQLNQVFSVPGDQFAKAVDTFMTNIKPVSDFLVQSVQAATDLFGRGLTAALEAATESDAKTAFFNTLNQGTKDVIFQGITQAFIASAQFNDLLAPIQQTIRDFTQQALATGQLPDLAAFRSAILPAIEALSTREDLLAPLIAELQKLGLDIGNKLATTTTAKTPTNITININGNINDAKDAEDLARRIEAMLNGQLSPS